MRSTTAAADGVLTDGHRGSCGSLGAGSTRGGRRSAKPECTSRHGGGQFHPRPAPRRPSPAQPGHVGGEPPGEGGQVRDHVAGAGRPADFYAVIGSVSSRRSDRTQLKFLAFDLLWLDGNSLTDTPRPTAADFWSACTS